MSNSTSDLKTNSAEALEQIRQGLNALGVTEEDVQNLITAKQICDSLRLQVTAFAMEMEGDLKQNDSQGGWDLCSPVYLVTKARKCLNQLDYALQDKQPAEVVRKHAAQCANYLMMIADNWGELVK